MWATILIPNIEYRIQKVGYCQDKYNLWIISYFGGLYSIEHRSLQNGLITSIPLCKNLYATRNAGALQGAPTFHFQCLHQQRRQKFSPKNHHLLFFLFDTKTARFASFKRRNAPFFLSLQSIEQSAPISPVRNRFVGGKVADWKFRARGCVRERAIRIANCTGQRTPHLITVTDRLGAFNSARMRTSPFFVTDGWGTALGEPPNVSRCLARVLRRSLDLCCANRRLFQMHFYRESRVPMYFPL